ncbi:MAG: BON domain-containing protein [Planctomycetales bacterium]|nr:BON domain-containing protein [Planctomycetales bacterium]
MISLTQMGSVRRSFWAASFATLFAINCSFSHGQQATGTATGTGDTGGGTQFQPEGPDLSAFSGIDRGESVGTASTQGFGLTAESTGGVTGAGRTGGGGGGGFGGGGLGGLFGALGSAFGGQSASSQKPTIRVRLRSAVDVAPLAAEQVQFSARRALSVTPRSGMRGVNVVMDGRTAILQGVVGSEKDRRMSELLIRLEPGVSRVDNQVVVEN